MLARIYDSPLRSPCGTLGAGVRTINSCLAPVGSLAGCSIVTAAGMGSLRTGFHPVQGPLPPCFLKRNVQRNYASDLRQ
jgi:aerobic-type carbon monoxide dehydrogenase small subunit (CoxS/CutS family)